MAVSVGNKINLDELAQVITPPVDKNVFLAANYDDMYNAMRQLAEDSCEYASGIILFVLIVFIIFHPQSYTSFLTSVSRKKLTEPSKRDFDNKSCLL